MKEACDQLQYNTFKTIREKLHGSSIGPRISNTIKDVVAIGAKDSLAESKLQAGYANVNDGSMPQMSVSHDSPTCTIASFSLARDVSTLVECIQESLDSVREGLSLMSSLRRSECFEGLKACFGRLYDLVLSFDYGYSTLFVEHWQS